MSNLIYAMGVDPGGTTGVAIIGVEANTIYGDEPGRIIHFETFEVTGKETDQAIAVSNAARRFKPLALIVESFYPAKPITSDEYLSPVRVGSKIEFMVDIGHTNRPLFWQPPSLAMETAPDRRLKAWGLYKAGPDHIKDGTRHAITFIRRAKSDIALRDQAWGPAELYIPRIERAVRRV